MTLLAITGWLAFFLMVVKHFLSMNRLYQKYEMWKNYLCLPCIDSKHDECNQKGCSCSWPHRNRPL